MIEEQCSHEAVRATISSQSGFRERRLSLHTCSHSVHRPLVIDVDCSLSVAELQIIQCGVTFCDLIFCFFCQNWQKDTSSDSNGNYSTAVVESLEEFSIRSPKSWLKLSNVKNIIPASLTYSGYEGVK